MRRVLAGLAVLVLGVTPSWANPGEGMVFRFPLYYTPASLDPAKDLSTPSITVVQQIFDGLVAFDGNLRVTPSLAQSWKVSRDGKEYRFLLRKGIRFHDGRPLEGEDVVASLTRLFRPGAGLPPPKGLEVIEGSEAFREGKEDRVSGLSSPSSREVIIRLLRPYSPFLSTLAMAQARILPRGDLAEREEGISRHPVGTGPFVFSSWDQEGITLKANPDYFLGRPALDEVRFRFYPQSGVEAALEDFLQGKLEGAALPPGGPRQKELEAKGHQVLVRPRLSLLFYGMDVRVPPFDDPRVRRALALCFDREVFLRREGGGYVPAAQVIPPGMPGYNPGNAILRFDPEGAARALREAGFPGGKGLPELTLFSASRSQFATRELERFVTDAARVGLRVRISHVDDFKSFQQGLREGKFPFYRYSWSAEVPDPDDMLAPLLETGSQANFQGFSLPAADRLMEKARSETDARDRARLYRDAERMLLEAAPLVPVLHLTSELAFARSVRGMDLTALGTHLLLLNKVSLAAP